MYIYIQRAGSRMQNGSGALGTDAPYHYWVQGLNARIFRGILSLWALWERAGVRGNGPTTMHGMEKLGNIPKLRYRRRILSNDYSPMAARSWPSPPVVSPSKGEGPPLDSCTNTICPSHGPA